MKLSKRLKPTSTRLGSFDIDTMKEFFLICWSSETSTLWSNDNPARGQCGVTALVVQDLFGGVILKTKVEGRWHFYNWIAGSRYDLTREQFESLPVYNDIPSTRDEVFEDTNRSQYECLAHSVNAALSRPFRSARNESDE